ncbi:unnamed protein product [Peniophora sp. CBMAI 1063]|nr:unnamed protein product [Peniophora sp. CBMAI 1063]
MAHASCIHLIPNYDLDSGYPVFYSPSMTSQAGVTDLGGLWSDALELYRKETKTDLLSCDFADDILECTSGDEVLNIIYNEMESFKAFRGDSAQWGKVRSVLKRVVDVVLVFNDAIAETAASQGIPGGKAILVGFGILLTATKGVSERYNALEELFSQVVAYLDRLLVRLEARTELRPAARTVVLNVLAHVIRVLALATRLLKKNRLVHWIEVVSGNHDMQDALAGLDKLTTLDTRMTLVENYATAQQILAEVEILRSNDEGQSDALQRIETHVTALVDVHIREWLAAPDSSANHDRAVESRHAGTCTWLLNNPALESWKNAESSLLWIHGKPGSGKTVLCASVIDYLNEDPTNIAASYYFDFRDVTKQDVHGLLVSLVLQLGDASTDCASLLRSFHARNSVKGKPGTSLLMALFKDLVSALAKPVYLVLDAIDECSPDTRRTKILPCLDELLRQSSTFMHILLSSRPEVDIREVFDEWRATRYAEEIDVHNVQSHSRDIESYIMHSLSSDSTFRKWPSHLVDLAQTSLHDKANGMFRWVSLQLDGLRKCLPKHVESALRSLPATLGETYLRILDSIEMTCIDDALRILQCIAFATAPLTAGELAEIFAIEFDKDMGCATLRPEYRVSNPLHEVLRLCSGLISVSSSLPENPHGAQISFAHFSVHEYLTSAGAPSQYHIDALEAHATLAQASISSLHSLNEDAPLNHHAVQNWMVYATFPGVAMRIAPLLDTLLLPSSHGISIIADPPASKAEPRAFYRWSELVGENHWKDVPAGQDRKSTLKLEVSYHPLICAAYFGFVEQAKHLMTLTTFPREVGRSALHAAVIAGHIEIMEGLLASGIVDDVNGVVAYVHNYARFYPRRRDLYGSERRLTLLHVACDARKYCRLTPGPISQAKVLQTLLDHGLDVNTRAEGRSPLHDLIYGWADSLAQGQFNALPQPGLLVETSIVPALNLLLSRGINVDAAALRLALDDRYMIGVREDPKSPRSLDEHPTGHLLELLFQHGADPNLRGSDGRAALHDAAAVGDVSVMRTLLEHCPEHANVLDAKKNTPLHCVIERASYQGDVRAMIELLISHGADVNARNLAGKTPLVAASLAGLYEDAKMLIACGADVNARDKDGRGVLHVPGLFYELAILFLEAGVDRKALDTAGRTALHYACSQVAVSRTNSVVHALLPISEGKDIVNVRDSNGQTALHYVCQNILDGSLDIVKTLLSRGADTNIVDERRCTALYYAASCRTWDPEILYALLKAEADPFDAFEGTPAHKESSQFGSQPLTPLSSARPASESITDSDQSDGPWAPVGEDHDTDYLPLNYTTFGTLEETPDPDRPWMETLRSVLNNYALADRRSEKQADPESTLAIQLRTRALIHLRLSTVALVYGVLLV